MKKLFLAFFIPFLLKADTFTVANYNVENLFDLVRSGSEYHDYIPFTSTQWNEKIYRIKLQNIAQVINDIKADIIAIEEIESDQALTDLQKQIKKTGLDYPYKIISSKKETTVHVALLSKFPIVSSQELMINPYDKIRSILEVKLLIDKKPLTVFVNHWKSKAGAESKRIPYAKALAKRLSAFKKDEAYLLVGDFNSNYNEYETFKKDQKLNNTKGITGINHFLKTLHKDKMNTLKTVKHSAEKGLHYDLWMELPKKKRFSYFYRGKAGTLDHIIIPSALLDQKGIDYLPKSFTVFAPDYLLHKKRINRWKFNYKKPAKHLGRGYSDHLPIVAKFSY